MAAALDKLQADTGLDVDIHVDGASGGFLAPFCAPDVVFDFRLPRVKSISASGHKFGLAPLGVGWVLWRDAAELPEDLIFHVNYLGGDMPVFQINFSRPAGQIIASTTTSSGSARGLQRASTRRPTPSASTWPPRSSSWARSSCCATATPPPGFPTVTWRIREGEDPGYTLFDLADRLRTRGLAGTRLHPHRNSLRHRRAAHPGPPGRQPGHGLPAAR